MRILFLLLPLYLPCLLANKVSAQTNALGGVQSKGIDMNTQPYGFITQISADTKEIIGNTYLHEQWNLGTIEFVNKAILENKSIRYNIESDVIEIRMDGVMKGAAGMNVKTFEIFNASTKERYVRASEFKFMNSQLLGFLRELHIDKYSLYSRTSVKLVKGQYVAALDMGEEDDTYSKKTVYFLVKDGELIEIEPNKKKFAANFPEDSKKVIDYINEYNISLKREPDLIRVITFVNSLSK